MIKIAGRDIGPDHPPFVIAEVAQSHEGSLGNAFAFAEIARDCGAHAIKFQTHIASEESTPSEPWRIPFSAQDASRYDYWRRMEFTFDQWAALKRHCDALGIVFLSSPFSVRACDWLEELDVPAWKVASGEITNSQLLRRMLASDKPVLLSSGLAARAQVLAAVKEVTKAGNPVALFHCTTQYPTPPEEVGLNVLTEYLAALPGVPVGLSDHSGTPVACTVAAYLGASLFEVHLTLHVKAFGPDVPASLDPEGLTRLVKGVEASWVMRQNPVEKKRQLEELALVKTTFGRSLFTTRDVDSGEVLTSDMIGYKKPGGGMPFEDLDGVLGRTAARTLPCNHMLRPDDVL